MGEKGGIQPADLLLPRAPLIRVANPFVLSIRPTITPAVWSHLRGWLRVISSSMMEGRVDGLALNAPFLLALGVMEA